MTATACAHCQQPVDFPAWNGEPEDIYRQILGQAYREHTTSPACQASRPVVALDLRIRPDGTGQIHCQRCGAIAPIVDRQWAEFAEAHDHGGT